MKDLNTHFKIGEFNQINSTDYSSGFSKFNIPTNEWYKGKLPHRDKIGLLQFITFRQANSLPQNVLTEIGLELEHMVEQKKKVEKRKRYEYWADQGLGSCALAHREMAMETQATLLHHDPGKYDLIAWSIMPNHVHTLIKTKIKLGKIVQSWKSYTGRWAIKNNAKFNLGIEIDSHQFWMADYWDRYIRNKDHFNNTIRYILNNPAKANLPKDHIAYKFRGLRIW